MSHKPNAQLLARRRKRYAHATKKHRMAMLDECVATIGYQRKHTSALLSGKRQGRTPDSPLRHLRRQFYTDEDQPAVLWLIALFDDIGSKRRHIAVNNALANLRCHNHLPAVRPVIGISNQSVPPR